ncbi:phosphodiester glycosidase family protein [Labrys portucalensis]|uniref:Phosphodiester glycosidase family protein n=1 Tax=Labrys neptuniae TaxID=376174 RepID=A0ABV6ZSI3_9HYPH
MKMSQYTLALTSIAIFYSMNVNYCLAAPAGIDKINKAITDYSVDGKKKIIVYETDGDKVYLTKKNKDGGYSDLTNIRSLLIIVTNASLISNNSPAIKATLSVNRSDYCEKDDVRSRQGMPQTMEIARPHVAINNFRNINEIDPTIILNVNYFDINTQLKNNQYITWQKSKCSTPLGIYYDSHSGRWNDAANQPHAFAYGDYYFSRKDGTKTALQSMLIVDKNTDRVQFNISDGNSNDAQPPAIESIETTIKEGKQELVAFSGAELLPRLNSEELDSGDGPDAGILQTTRIGIGYNVDKDQLYILQAGYGGAGISRGDLRDIFSALGASKALELDGGGSAVLGVQKDAVTWTGINSKIPNINEKDSSIYSCGSPVDNDFPTGIAKNFVCTPAYQLDGTRRALPGYLALSIGSAGKGE